MSAGKLRDVVIIGAGPYGLSLAAHLERAGISHTIVGQPMELWRHHMPQGMLLKSDGFASNLSDPQTFYPLSRHCRDHGIPYDDETVPVELSTFVGYGLEFAKRMTPQLKASVVEHLTRRDGVYFMRTDAGEELAAKSVVVAVGVGPFRQIPDSLSSISPPHLSHSFDHHDLSSFNGRRVAVIGAGASAIDLAALLGETGCEVELICRAERLRFGSRPSGQRKTLLKRVRSPRSGLGPGWKSRLCTDAPLLFHFLPRTLRHTIVKRHLGPAASWRMLDMFERHVTVRRGCTIVDANSAQDGVRLCLQTASGTITPPPFDHVIAATGYKPDVSRLSFIDEPLRRSIANEDQAPVLSTSFESSVPGLFFVGPAAAASFGPLMRFVFGAEYAAKRVSGVVSKRRLATSANPTSATDMQ